MREGGGAAKGRTLRLGRLAGRHAAAVTPTVCAAIIDDVGFGVDGRRASLQQYNSILREEMSKVGIEYYDTSHRKVIAYCPARSLGWSL